MPVTGSLRAPCPNAISTRGPAGVCAVSRTVAMAARPASAAAASLRIPCLSVFICGYASKMRAGVLVLMAAIGFLPAQRSGDPVPVYGYQVVRSYPHDRDAFTQGLIFRDGVFYEGTGLN